MLTIILIIAVILLFIGLYSCLKTIGMYQALTGISVERLANAVQEAKRQGLL